MTKKYLPEKYCNCGRKLVTMKIVERGFCGKCYTTKMMSTWNKSNYANNKEMCKKSMKNYYEKNKEKFLNKTRDWRNNNREKYRITKKKVEARRRALKYSSPIYKFYKKEIDLIYDNCPEGMQVDHIIPIKGKNVTGLHVPWNLQYLTPSENASKGNRF